MAPDSFVRGYFTSSAFSASFSGFFKKMEKNLPKYKILWYTMDIKYEGSF